ncbi:hypothetical protein NDN08_000854 [Rhodosorus marinus]|uniref:Glucose phosphomutase n=1 Tax=Rhodosorus marinus TaxID=101924 RepID=A0AAV8URY5_9RHOD|nr:hypothetical protein NDN08_000854 [Rhodosorus marinus]
MSFVVKSVETKPIEGQKTGTSGLRKKTKLFTSENYLANWVQSLFNSLDDLEGKTIALGGDGRYFNKEAIQIILRLAAGNGVAKVIIGQSGIMCTPGLSAVIRKRGLYGGIILTASHNPAGPEEDFGIKYNVSNGGPAPESVTEKILEQTLQISELKMASASETDSTTDCVSMFDIDKIGVSKFSGPKEFEVEVIDSTQDYFELLKTMFDFESIQKLFAREDFTFLFDAMNAVTGPYARKLFIEILGAPENSVMRGTCLEDFGGGHPDPNLTYAAELVKKCDPAQNDSAPDMGAASDGDGDRNMILGKGFFVTPNDSLAVIVSLASECIPYFKGRITGAARSMPTAGAVDKVAEKLGLECFETPTGWKYFGNLLDAGRAQICGEESFGTGADHVREKDGLFAILCWLQILAVKNADASAPLVSVESIVKDHWATYGRNFFSRYDYEGVETDAAAKMMGHLAEVQDGLNKNAVDGLMKLDNFGVKLTTATNFSYTDPIDGSVAQKQGLMFAFEDSSRIIFRLSGTGSSGATIRMYIEKYESDPEKQLLDAQVALKEYIDLALQVSNLKGFTGREKPTVIT